MLMYLKDLCGVLKLPENEFQGVMTPQYIHHYVGSGEYPVYVYATMELWQLIVIVIKEFLYSPLVSVGSTMYVSPGSRNFMG